MAPELAAARGATRAAGAASGRPHGSAVYLAVSIMLLWLACLALFFAFEGTKFLGGSFDAPGAGGYPSAIETAIQSKIGTEESS